MLALLLLIAGDPTGGSTLQISPNPQQWHPVEVTWTGPAADESDTPSPFVRYRLDAEFTHVATGQSLTVPGFFAADGDAAHTGATGGDCWRVRFAPPKVGDWTVTPSFTDEGRPVPLPGGSLTVAPSTAASPDLRHHGTLRPGGHHLVAAGSGRRWFRIGVGSPETLLGYHDFDGTWLDRAEPKVAPPHGPITLPSLDAGLHRYADHVADWSDGDPTWSGGRGKGLIGGINYLASRGINSMYFVTMNVNGDGRNVWPWTSPWEHTRFDVSKLGQWEIVFSHMQSRGVAMQIVLQETENDHLLDRGDLGPDRRRYLREMVARFAHHPGLVWNLGEENLQTPSQQRAMADFLRGTDPYGHAITIHNDHYDPANLSEMFDPLVGEGVIDGTSIQDFHWNDVHAQTLRYRAASAAAGQPWFVCVDEMGGAMFGLPPDADDPGHHDARTKGLWGNLMAGGAGVSWYFGWQNNSPQSDLSAESWRPREEMWQQSRIARDIFETLVTASMRPADDRTLATNDYVLAGDERTLIYLPTGGATRLDLGDRTGPHRIRWVDPRTGETGLQGSTDVAWGPGLIATGDPPNRGRDDWLAVVESVEPVWGTTERGDVVIEAERFETQTRDGRRRWRVLRKSGPLRPLEGAGEATTWTRSMTAAAPQASGNRFIRLLPDTRRTHDDRLIRGENFSPEPGQMAVLSYRIHIDTPGRYYVWARLWSTGTEDNGLHVGLDGDWPEHGRRMQWCEGKNRWTWSSAQRTEQNPCGEPHGIWIDIAQPGEHTFGVSMREDGAAVDQFLLTRDREFVPKGAMRDGRLHESKQ